MKETVKKEIKTEEEAKKTSPAKKERYFEAIGRRKTAIARVRLLTKKKEFTVNEKNLDKYFSLERLVKVALRPLEAMKITDKLGASIKVSGGGTNAQAEAIRMGISRALVKFNPLFMKRLRKLGFLTRDSRAVERKKYGLKKARRAPQWTKR